MSSAVGIMWIVAGFLAAQCVCCGAALWGLGGRARAIKRREVLGDWGPDEASEGEWLDWTRAAFSGEGAGSVGWSRQDAFDTLDDMLSARQSYQCLQRLGVAAPLLGVLITAIGLMGLTMPSDASVSLSAILDAIRPLFLGVIVGASLAMINLVLLQVVEWRAERLRSVARRWFDRAVWGPSTAAPGEAARATIAALGELARSIQASADVHDRGAQRVRKAARAMTRASLASDGAFRSFEAGLGEFSSQVDGLREAVESTRVAAEATAPALQGTRAVLNQAVSRFAEAVAGQFVPASMRCAEAMGLSRESSAKTLSLLTGLDQSVAALQQRSEALGEFTTDLGRTGGALNETINAVLAPAHQTLLDASRTLNHAASSLPSLFQGASAAFFTTAEGLRTTLERDLAPAAAQLHESIKGDLGPAAEHQNQIMREAGAVADGLRALFERVEGSSTALEDRYASLAESTNRQAAASEEIHESLRQVMIPAHQAVGRSATELADSAGLLAQFVREGLTPATAALAELGQVIGPMSEAAEAIRSIGEANGRLGELAATAQRLHEAIESAGALRELEPIIEQLSRSFVKADELRRAIADMPDLYGQQLRKLSQDALRSQADDLREILADIARQFGLFTVGNGRTANSPHQ